MSLLSYSGLERFAARVFASHSGLIHEEREASGPAVACGFGSRREAAVVLAERDVEEIARRLLGLDVFRHQPGPNERRQIGELLVVPHTIDEFSGGDALQHRLRFSVMRINARFEEELFAALLNDLSIFAITDNPRARFSHQRHRLRRCRSFSLS